MQELRGLDRGPFLQEARSSLPRLPQASDWEFEAKYRELMTQTKNQIRESLRESSKCFIPLSQNNKLPENIVVVQKNKSDYFALEPFQATYVVIENLKQKPQPVYISLTGVRGELLALLSTTNPFPTEESNQKRYINQTELQFCTSNVLSPSQASSAQFDLKKGTAGLS